MGRAWTGGHAGSIVPDLFCSWKTGANGLSGTDEVDSVWPRCRWTCSSHVTGLCMRATINPSRIRRHVLTRTGSSCMRFLSLVRAHSAHTPTHTTMQMRMSAIYTTSLALASGRTVTHAAHHQFPVLIFIPPPIGARNFTWVLISFSSPAASPRYAMARQASSLIIGVLWSALPRVNPNFFLTLICSRAFPRMPSNPVAFSSPFSSLSSYERL